MANKQNGNNKSDGIRGAINLSEDVVATIAGVAARDIEGIHSIGRSRIMRLGDSPTRGVDVEVGETEAAVDVEVVIDYGCDLDAVASQLRERIATEVGKMCNRRVVEVNLDVVDVNLPEPKPEPEKEQSRVR